MTVENVGHAENYAGELIAGNVSPIKSMANYQGFVKRGIEK